PASGEQQGDLQPVRLQSSSSKPFLGGLVVELDHHALGVANENLPELAVRCCGRRTSSMWLRNSHDQSQWSSEIALGAAMLMLAGLHAPALSHATGGLKVSIHAPNRS